LTTLLVALFSWDLGILVLGISLLKGRVSGSQRGRVTPRKGKGFPIWDPKKEFSSHFTVPKSTKEHLSLLPVQRNASNSFDHQLQVESRRTQKQRITSNSLATPRHSFGTCHVISIHSILKYRYRYCFKRIARPPPTPPDNELMRRHPTCLCPW
jgi:hypothetical protein